MKNTILNHRSIRKFKTDSINESILNEIIYAGSRASTTGNMQLYSIVVTTNTNLKKQLWEAHFKQEMVLQAPVHFTFCADFNRFTKWCNYRKANPGYDNFLSFFTAAIDALLMAQNVALAAEDKGYGICYLGTATYNADKIIDILELPQLVVPVTAIVLGIPDENPQLTDRLPLEGIIHKDKYKDYSENVINKIYKQKEALKQTLELLEINNKETLAQIFTDNRYKKEDNELFSKKYLEVIKKQGFMGNN